MTSSSRQGRTESDRWARVAELFELFSPLSPEEREQAIARLSPEDADLAGDVRRLLDRSPRVEKFLREPVAARAVEAVRRQQLAPAELAIGEVVDDYEIIRVLGSGGVGVVYLARQRSLDRRVALKVVPLRRALLHEARAMAGVDHENIVQVFGEWEDAVRGVKFLVMQYVSGVALDVVEKALKELPAANRTGNAALAVVDARVGDTIALDPAGYANRERLRQLDGVETVLLLGIQLANALAYAHARGVLHLDMKAGNVLLTPSGRPMLADFGVALRTGTHGGRQTENLGGTLGYMSPEQLAVFDSNDGDVKRAVENLDGRADVFALGKLLAELLEGLDVPLEIETLLRRATAERRDDRLASAAAFAAALESVLEWRRATRALPRGGFFLSWASRYPLLVLTLAGAVPQFAASYVGIRYNSLRVVSRLSETQQAWFARVNGLYTPFTYAVAGVLWSLLVLRLVAYFRDPAAFGTDAERTPRLRAFALRLPWMGAVVTLGSWLPGAVLFPAAMNVVAGPLDGLVIFHLATAFVLSCSLALGYTFLLHSTIVLRWLYPRLWVGDETFAGRSQTELHAFERAIRAAGGLVAAVPLVGAFLILWQGAERGRFDSWWDVQLLVSALLGLTVLGITGGARAVDRLVECVRTLRRR